MTRYLRGLSGLATAAAAGAAVAHEPVFSPGPSVMFRDGHQIRVETETQRRDDGDQRDSSLALRYSYSPRADLALMVRVPYRELRDNDVRRDGWGDAELMVNYAFWNRSALAQRQLAGFRLGIISDTGESTVTSGTTDYMASLAYSYESLTWYWWASARYRYNTTGADGISRGDRIFLDAVVGYRPGEPGGYGDPYAVWMLELNTEHGRPDGGERRAETGGTEVFLSPAVRWTVLANVSIKAGVQVPVLSDLRGDRPESDIRAKLQFEWNF